MSETYKTASRRDWHRAGELEEGDVRTGCLQRIADATELMAKNHRQLVDDCDRYKREVEWERSRVMTRDRRIAGLRGQITKLTKRLQLEAK